MGDETDKSKVPKSQGQEVGPKDLPKDLQGRAVGLEGPHEGPQGQSVGPKVPADREGVEVSYTSLLSVKGAISLKGDRSPLFRGYD